MSADTTLHQTQLHYGENERIRPASSGSILPGVEAPRIINHWPSVARRRSSRHMKVNVKVQVTIDQVQWSNTTAPSPLSRQSNPLKHSLLKDPDSDSRRCVRPDYK